MDTGSAPRMRDLPQGDRPRERLWVKGPEALADAELLALVLRNGRPGESALSLATRMLVDFGGLHRIAMAGAEELATYAGIGPAKAASLVAALHLARRATHPSREPMLIKHPEDLAAIAAEALLGSRRERVIVLVLDSGHRLKRVVPVSEGSMDRSLFPIREILNAVLRYDGRTFAVAHNHPGGDTNPTSQDLRATQALRDAAEATGLRFLDHLIVGNGDWRSINTTDARQRHG